MSSHGPPILSPLPRATMIHQKWRFQNFYQRASGQHYIGVGEGRETMILGDLSGSRVCTACSLCLLRQCLYLQRLCGAEGNHNVSPSPAGMKFCFSWVLSAQGLSWSCGKAEIWASHAPASALSLPSALHFGLCFCQPGGTTSS